MPGFYAAGEYDIAGFIVGVVDRARVIDGARVQAGDALIGLPSSGLHTNGYSLARRIVFDTLHLGVDDYVAEIGATVADALLAPHRSYLRDIRPLLGSGSIKAMAHITGGGITENLPRVLPPEVHALIDTRSWEVPSLFQWLARSGGVPDDEMRRTFNMGIGLIVVCDTSDVSTLLPRLADARVIGKLAPGAGAVQYD
jgi:phosphoribosylformylglycinamidine cyclo-ligase